MESTVCKRYFATARAIIYYGCRWQQWVQTAIDLWSVVLTSQGFSVVTRWFVIDSDPRHTDLPELRAHRMPIRLLLSKCFFIACWEVQLASLQADGNCQCQVGLLRWNRTRKLDDHLRALECVMRHMRLELFLLAGSGSEVVSDFHLWNRYRVNLCYFCP